MAADPHELGPYRIVRPVGRGGMGVVYEAVHSGLDKRVALKVLPRGLDADRLARFLREARTAAALHHTNIVPVFDAGEVDGVPYYAMQFIDGRPLDITRGAAADNAGPPTRTRPPGTRTGTFDPALPPTQAENATAAAVGPDPGPARGRTDSDPWHVAALGLQAAEGLAYAHERGVVHRDVKPSNLLLDSAGVVWIADFGLAFRTDDPTITGEGAILGTPRYMSPEQARAERTDARTDVYSLGVTLYELLTGTPAFDGDSALDTLRKVLAHTPPRPRDVNPRVPRDLETVLLKAMAKPPEDRYPSGRELADDLRRFLAGEPVKARRISVAGRAWRWAKRNPAVASLLAAVVLVSTVGAGVSAYFAREAEQREREARHSATVADRLALESRDQAEAARREAARAGASEEQYRRLAYAARVGLAGVALREHDPARAAELLRETLPRPGEDDPRGWEWHFLFRAVHPETRVAVWPGVGEVIAAGADRVVRLRPGDGARRFEVWDATTGTLLSARDAPADMAAAGDRPRFPTSADARRLVYRTAEDVVVWEPETGREVLRLPPAAHRDSSPPALSPAGDRLARFVPQADHGPGKPVGPAYEVWDLESGKRAAVLVPPRRFGSTYSARAARFSPDGSRLGVVIDGRRCVAWDTASGAILLDRAPGAAPAGAADAPAPTHPGLSFAAGGRWLALRPAGGDRVEVFDLSGPAIDPSDTIPVPGGADAVELSPDGRAVAVTDASGAVTVFDRTGADPPRVLRTVFKDLRTVGFTPDGRRLLGLGPDRLVEWDLSHPTTARLTGPPPLAASVAAGAIRPDGRAVALFGTWPSDRGPVRALRVRDPDGRLGRLLLAADLAAGATPAGLSWSPDGRRLAALLSDPLGPGAAAGLAGLGAGAWPGPGAAAALVRAGRERSPADRVVVLDPEAGRVVGGFWPRTAGARAVRFSPCGRWLAVDAGEGTAVHEAGGGRLVRWVAGGHGAAAGSFSPDGGSFVSAGGEIVLCDLTGGREERVPLPGAAAGPVEVAPGGRWVAVVGGGRPDRLTVWDAGARRVAAEFPLEGEPGGRRAAFSPDGRLLLVRVGGRRFDLVAAGAWERVRTLTGGPGGAADLAFSPDGRRVLALFSGDGGQELWVWDAGSGQELLALPLTDRRPARAAFGSAFDGHRFVASRRFGPDGPAEVETLDGTPVPGDVVRERLGAPPR